MDEEDLCLQFAHHSVKQFLVRDPYVSTLGAMHVELHYTDMYVGEICVTYLCFTDFERQLVKPTQLDKILNPADLAKTSLSSNSSSRLVNYALALSKRRSKSGIKYDVFGKQLVDIASDASMTKNLSLNYPLLTYVRKHWLAHTKEFCGYPSLELHKSVWNSWDRLLHTDTSFAEKPSILTASTNGHWAGESALKWIMDSEHSALLVRWYQINIYKVSFDELPIHLRQSFTRSVQQQRYVNDLYAVASDSQENKETTYTLGARKTNESLLVYSGFTPPGSPFFGQSTYKNILKSTSDRFLFTMLNVLPHHDVTGRTDCDQIIIKYIASSISTAAKNRTFDKMALVIRVLPQSVIGAKARSEVFRVASALGQHELVHHIMELANCVNTANSWSNTLLAEPDKDGNNAAHLAAIFNRVEVLMVMHQYRDLHRCHAERNMNHQTVLDLARKAYKKTSEMSYWWTANTIFTENERRLSEATGLTRRNMENTFSDDYKQFLGY